MRVGFLCECFGLRWLVDLVVLGFRWFVAIYILQVPQDWALAAFGFGGW